MLLLLIHVNFGGSLPWYWNGFSLSFYHLSNSIVLLCSMQDIHHFILIIFPTPCSIWIRFKQQVSFKLWIYDIGFVLLLTCSISIMYFKFAHSWEESQFWVLHSVGFLKYCRRVKHDGDELWSRSVLITYRFEC